MATAGRGRFPNHFGLIWQRAQLRRVLNFGNRETASASVATDFLLGTAGSGPSYFGILKRWTGAAWVRAELKRYTGGGWSAAALKRWNGSEWVLVDTTG